MNKVLILLILAVLLSLVFILINNGSGAIDDDEIVVDDYHIHFDMRVVINGEDIDFSKTEYQSDKEEKLDHFVHFHDGDGGVVHIHTQDQDLETILNSFDYELSLSEGGGCLTNKRDGVQYCSDEKENLRVFSNGIEIENFTQYVPQDLERILIIFGSGIDSILDDELELVTDRACIQSGKCPERGEPTDEAECSGGSLSGCDVVH